MEDYFKKRVLGSGIKRKIKAQGYDIFITTFVSYILNELEENNLKRLIIETRRKYLSAVVDS